MDVLTTVPAVGSGRPVLDGSHRSSRLARTALLALLCSAVSAAGVALVRLEVFVTSRDAPIPPPALSPLRVLRDIRPVRVTSTTSSWTKVQKTVTVDAIRTDHRLWREMHFDDWDALPTPMRQLGLGAMVRSYASVFKGVSTWRNMTVAYWDDVPQPVRAMAYLRMIWYWAVAEDVGSEFGHQPEVLAHTIAGIVMAESWFEHRAVNQNAWGNRDLGLAQCSDYCRETIDAMAAAGEILFAPADEDYFDPWVATRVATVWFKRELQRAGGDVDLAIGAYHRGIDAATDEKGTAYHAHVVRLRERYIRTQQASPSWRFLVRAITPL